MSWFQAFISPLLVFDLLSVSYFHRHPAVLPPVQRGSDQPLPAGRHGFSHPLHLIVCSYFYISFSFVYSLSFVQHTIELIWFVFNSDHLWLAVNLWWSIWRRAHLLYAFYIYWPLVSLISSSLPHLPLVFIIASRLCISYSLSQFFWSFSFFTDLSHFLWSSSFLLIFLITSSLPHYLLSSSFPLVILIFFSYPHFIWSSLFSLIFYISSGLT